MKKEKILTVKLIDFKRKTLTGRNYLYKNISYEFSKAFGSIGAESTLSNGDTNIANIAAVATRFHANCKDGLWMDYKILDTEQGRILKENKNSYPYICPFGMGCVEEDGEVTRYKLRGFYFTDKPMYASNGISNELVSISPMPLPSFKPMNYINVGDKKEKEAPLMPPMQQVSSKLVYMPYTIETTSAKIHEGPFANKLPLKSRYAIYPGYDVVGNVIFNTTTNRTEYYDGSSWNAIEQTIENENK